MEASAAEWAVNRPALIHPQLMESLTPVFYDSEVTIQANTPTRDSIGGVTDGFDEVTGLMDLACSIAPLSDAGPSGSREQRGVALTVTTDHLLCAIPQYLPQITDEMRAVVNDVVWNITGSQADSHQTMTRLVLEKVTT